MAAENYLRLVYKFNLHFCKSCPVIFFDLTN